MFSCCAHEGGAEEAPSRIIIETRQTNTHVQYPHTRGDASSHDQGAAHTKKKNRNADTSAQVQVRGCNRNVSDTQWAPLAVRPRRARAPRDDCCRNHFQVFGVSTRGHLVSSPSLLSSIRALKLVPGGGSINWYDTPPLTHDRYTSIK